MYIKINGSDEHYDASIRPFITQGGNSAIKIIGNVPLTDKGFKVYDEYDVVFSDFSDYIYSYGDNEYTTVIEERITAECSFQPIAPSALSNLIGRVNQIANQVDINTANISEVDDALCDYTTDIDERVGELEDSFCEYTTDMDERVGEVEDSLCELSENTEEEE